MRNIILAAVIILVACFQCSAQNQNTIDSLFNILKETEEDTIKVNILINLAWNLSGSNPDTSLILANEALTLSEKIRSKKHIAKSYHEIARANSEKGNYPSSLEYNFKALAIREELADKPGIARSLYNIGTLYS